MSAKQMRTMLIVTCACVLSAAVSGPGSTALGQSSPSSSGSAPARSERLNRDDVDKLLTQARAAIKAGNFDDADTLVRRAEQSGISYGFLYVGATPASVRRELTNARKEHGPTNAAPPATRSTGQTPNGNRTPASTNANPANDPFLRGTTPATPNSSARSGATQPERTGASVYATDRYDTPEQDRQPIVQTAYGEESPLATPDALNLNASNSASPRAGASAVATDSISSANSRWALPDASLPRAQSTDRTTAGRAAAPPRSPKDETLIRLAAARQAMESGNFDLAEQLVREASALGVPESHFLPSEDRPSLVAGDLQRVLYGKPQSPPQTAVRADLNPPAAADRYATQAGPAMNPLGQPSGMTVQATSPINFAGSNRLSLLPDPIDMPTDAAPSVNPLPSTLGQAQSMPPAAAGNDASRLLQEGEAALRRRDREAALQLFGQAHILRDQLPLTDRQRLQDHLQMMASQPAQAAATTATNALATNPSGQATQAQALGRPLARPGDFVQSDLTPMPLGGDQPLAAPAGDSLESADARGQVLARQLQTEVGRAQTEARRLVETKPKEAFDLLNATRQKVLDAQLSSDIRNQLLSRLDVTLENTRQFIEEHRSELELDDRNKAVLAQIDREREMKAKVRGRIGEMVEEFNKLRDEQRYAEMEVVARRLYEMAPDDPVVQQVYTTAKFIRREIMNRQLADLKEDSVFRQLHDADASAVNPTGDGREVAFDAKYWDDFVKNRKGTAERNPRSPRELEIERRLQTPVRVNYNATPLSQVTQELSQLAGVNIHLDPRGLNQEGLQTDTPVSLNLNTDISLKSVLSLILTPLHLSYVIKDEVLQITSNQISKGELKLVTYYVADLVTPIPNFVPSANMGLQGMLNDAYSAMGRGPNGFGPLGPGVLVNQNHNGLPGGAQNANVLAQQLPPASNIPGAMQPIVPVGGSGGPGGLGGGANADFDSLIDLIVSTVAPDTWAEQGGGTAEVRPFPTNLSLVISQTQAIHEEIADLLEQLRRLQDLQITIECRFIRLNDSFFERIGIDFDMNIEDRTIGTADLLPGTPFEGGRQTAIVGMNVPTGVNDFPRFSNDLDIPIRQNSFELTALPPFGQPADVARFGFAILSDIEAYFLIEAAQGDRRTNVLNAPKVTLFNGQQATITDQTQTPFVVSVVPVVGEFVAASQPVIVVLNEGTNLTIQAVASEDRRYVRLTVVPSFTQIGDVRTFTFEGSSTSTSSSSSTDDDEDGKNEEEDESNEDTTAGTTVQQPSFQTLTVTTTVSVPDGGTVLLGGIKRMSEGRNEFGVPLLSKLPYISRLFKNIAIGRETDSLMIMVTPRIIIQEEEEERLGIDTTQ